MKKLFILIAAVSITACVFAQAPQFMSYQAVIRDASGNLATNTNIGMQISILQGSSGTPVYVERHFPTTNANGLVTIEIANGTIVTGVFSTIDWTNGPYFIKTETDLNGGSSYTITGTSQLLSVPYALHSNIADSIVGGIGSHADSLDIANFGYVAGTHTIDTDTQLDSIGVVTLGFVAGAHTIDTDTQLDSTSIVNMGFTASTTYSVGDFAQGGIVFWVDETGQHGLVCAKENQSSGVRWYAGTNGVTRAKGDWLFAGEMNTAIIIASQVAIGDDGNTYAAYICATLQITEGGKTYGDWYLPSKQELNLMYQNKTTINTTAAANGGSAFASNSYWSSTEYNSSYAWYQSFNSGNKLGNTKSLTFYVRVVRAF